MKKIIVTTSWDDGDKLDVKLAELLNKYNLKGTFYITEKYKNRSLSGQELKVLGQNQEIGAHSLSHPHLTALSRDGAKKEIAGAKEYLENLLRREIKMFCYPYGEFNEEIKNLVKEAGFLGARTTRNFCTQPSNDFFEFDTTLQIYPFPLRKKDADHYDLSRSLFEPLQQNFRQILKLKLPPNAFFNWLKLAKSQFNYSLKKGKMFHLWGHSWEIEKYGMWQELEEIFKYISQRPNVLYLTNSQTLENL